MTLHNNAGHPIASITAKRKPACEPVRFSPHTEPFWAWMSEEGESRMVVERFRVYWLWWVFMVDIGHKRFDKEPFWEHGAHYA